MKFVQKCKNSKIRKFEIYYICKCCGEHFLKKMGINMNIIKKMNSVGRLNSILRLGYYRINHLKVSAYDLIRSFNTTRKTDQKFLI